MAVGNLDQCQFGGRRLTVAFPPDVLLGLEQANGGQFGLILSASLHKEQVELFRSPFGQKKISFLKKLSIQF